MMNDSQADFLPNRKTPLAFSLFTANYQSKGRLSFDFERELFSFVYWRITRFNIL
jgi:hypothetical protein